MEFSEKLVCARKHKALSQEALAEKIGVSRQAVSKWETGEAKPDLDKLIALCQVLELSMDQLCLDREASAPPTPERKTDKNRLWVVLVAIAGLIAGVILSVMLFGLATKVDGNTQTVNPGEISVADAGLTGAGGSLTVSLTLSREVPGMQVRIFAVDHFTGDRTELTALSADGSYQAEYTHGDIYDVKFLAEVTHAGEKVNLPLFNVEGEGQTFTSEELWR